MFFRLNYYQRINKLISGIFATTFTSIFQRTFIYFPLSGTLFDLGLQNYNLFSFYQTFFKKFLNFLIFFASQVFCCHNDKEH